MEAANRRPGVNWSRRRSTYRRPCKGAVWREKVAKGIEQVREHCRNPGYAARHPQTGPEGPEGAPPLHRRQRRHQKEYYVSVLTDRATQRWPSSPPAKAADIEEVAHATPEKIIKVFVDPLVGLTDAQAAEIATGIGLPRTRRRRPSTSSSSTPATHMSPTLVEINPSTATARGQIIALDAKFLRRQRLVPPPRGSSLRDIRRGRPGEVGASKFDLAISLGGSIGCLVNGAGLAMATMDTIKLFDCRTRQPSWTWAAPPKVCRAFKIVLRNPRSCILVNIFSGMCAATPSPPASSRRCKAVNLSVPLVIAHEEGTNEDLGKQMLADSGLPIISAIFMARSGAKSSPPFKPP